MQEKLETCQNSNLTYLEDHILRWYKCNIYIVKTSALDFKQLHIVCKFCPIKRIFLSERIPYLAQIFDCSSQTYLHISKSMYVVFHWKQIIEVFVNYFRYKFSLHKNWSFPLRISSVNVTKSTGICRFGHVYWRNP